MVSPKTVVAPWRAVVALPKAGVAPKAIVAAAQGAHLPFVRERGTPTG